MSSSQRNIITGHNMELHENIDRIKQMMGVVSESSDKNISHIIQLISKEYEEEYQTSTWDINNGLCEDFAQDVIEKMGGYNDNLFEVAGDMFFNMRDPEFALENWSDTLETDYGVWGVNLLKKWGYPPNVNLEDVDDELNHTWIYYNGKHYDAEAPNGVRKWYDLPLNKLFFNQYRKD